MRVLQLTVSTATRAGGVPVFVGGLTEALTAAGVEVEVFATDLARAPWGLSQRQRTVSTGDIHPGLAGSSPQLFGTRFPRRLARSPDLARALRSAAGDFDVVHIHNLWQHPQLAAYRAARAAGTPYVVSPHGGFDHYLRDRGRARKWLTGRLWQDEMLKQAAAIHVTTPTEQETIADIAPRVPRAVIPCGLDVAEFADPPPGDGFRDRHLDGYAGPLIVFLGRITEKKGIDVLIRAFAIARERTVSRLAVIGPDDTGSVPELRRLAADLGVGEQVTFIDAVYGDERQAALGAADVWALSSHTENFGIAVVEAMAAGCAVLVSPAVNIAPEITTSGAGHVAPAEPERFAEALVSLLSDEAERRRLEETAPAFARRYDWKAVVAEFIELYERVGNRCSER